jgi:hypothetical protein
MNLQVKARFVREATGTTAIEDTAKRVVEVLSRAGIPTLIGGGMAVQENGYARMTTDVDVIVPDVAAAREYLSIRGFRPNPGSSMTLTDRETKVEVDLLPGGGSVGPGPLKLPLPTVVVSKPKFLDLPELIAIKLSSYLGSPGKRLKDLADVQELLKVRNLPRDLKLPKEVKDLYMKTWDGLQD